MNCREVQTLLVEYDDGELPDANADTIGAHLEECGECRTRLAQHRRVGAYLSAQVPIDPGPEFRAGVMAAIAREPAPVFHRASSSIWPVALSVAMGGFIVAVALAYGATMFDLGVWQETFADLTSVGDVLWTAGGHVFATLGQIVLRASVEFSGTVAIALAVDVALILAFVALARAWSNRRLERIGSIFA